MSSKDVLKRVIGDKEIGRIARKVRRVARNRANYKKVVRTAYEFIDRSSGSDKMCMVLAGYKEPLWDEVFGRLARFVPEDVDVCIMTSGLVNEKLKAIAAEHGWSYLSTDVNHLSQVQNLAIECHPKAQWIYKLDEDMFLTRGFFEKTLEAYEYAESSTPYVPAFVSPLINVNCYGHLRLLDKMGLTADFAATGLTNMKYTDGLNHSNDVLENPAVARYMWGESCEELRDIDAMNERFMAEPLTISVCPMRFSIGAILFTREAWNDFGKFPLTFVGSAYGIGDDEEHICHYAMFTGRAIVVCENSLVGHLGYGPQTSAMIEYYLAHQDRFALGE